MPWSAWHQPPDIEVRAWGRFLTRAYVVRTPEGGFPAWNEGEPDYYVERLDGTPGGVGYDANFLEATWTDIPGDQPPRWHIQFLMDDNDPPSSTLALPFLPEGYFDELPDVWPPPEFDWEAEESTHLGWAWSKPAEIVSRAGAPEQGEIQLIVPSDYFTHGGVGYNLADHPTYPLPNGTPVLSFDGSDPVGSTLGTMPDPGPVAGFAVTIDVVNPGVMAGVTVDIGDLYARVRQPRWRYWIEGGAPLRLMQRGDNLGMGSARLFGPGTRQGSGRLFGSL